MFKLRHFHSILLFTAFSGILFITVCERQPPSGQPPAPAPIPVAASPAERLEKIKAELAEVKLAVANEGNYLCCVKPACDWCLLHEGECECRENLEAKKEVCPGCGLGWHNGQGVVKGVKASQVKWNVTHSHGGEGHAH